MGTGNEFVGLRAKFYKDALTEYLSARKTDIQLMHQYLNPQLGEYILGIGEGNGYFCKAIAEAIGFCGSYLVTDPSQAQLDNLLEQLEKVCLPQIEVKRMGAEELEAPSNSYDKVWSCGAFHHCPNQTEAMRRIYNLLKPGGKVVVCDVFQGTPLAKYFDLLVGRYCETGHEVKFLSEDFARTLCYLAGFADEKVDIVDVPHQWYFGSEYDIGVFIYKLNAMTKLPGREQDKIKQILDACREILSIEYKQGVYVLHWQQKAIIAEK